jgi:hypothetical protein
MFETFFQFILEWVRYAAHEDFRIEWDLTVIVLGRVMWEMVIEIWELGTMFCKIKLSYQQFQL